MPLRLKQNNYPTRLLYNLLGGHGHSKTGGALLANGSVPSTNTPAPDASGTYKISICFFSRQYKVTQ